MAVTVFLISSMAIGVFGKIGQAHGEPFNKRLSKMRREIRHLESKLGKTQDRRGATKATRKKLEEEERTLRGELNAKREVLEKDRDEIEQMLAVLAVHSLGESSDLSDMLAKEVTIEKLRSKREGVIKRISKIREFKKTLSNLSDRRLKFIEIESELTSLLSQLKQRKKIKSDQYMKISQKGMRRGKIILDLPLQKHTKAIYGKKGVTLKYRGNQKLYATGSGKIDFVGTLGKYGTVVMIDHGNDTRSVLLGPLEAKVEKGWLVEKGEEIGSVGPGPSGREMYFEVRLKNKIQRASRFMGDAS